MYIINCKNPSELGDLEILDWIRGPGSPFTGSQVLGPHIPRSHAGTQYPGRGGSARSWRLGHWIIGIFDNWEIG